MKGDINPLLPKGTLIFTAYDDDYIEINRDRHYSGLCVHQSKIISPWGPERLTGLKTEHLTDLVKQAPEVLLLGTGRLTAFPDAEIMQYLTDHHIGFECMDSRSAARTYNILIAEGRTVSAAMLLPGARK
jgi:NADH dehydrogenase [ubiquinone] 1 alpha subcomplex assembly factor 3